ncbi:hypothetical protein ACLQ26_08250 [Micromonospora sp. DT43]|uniref:hypothetical protein n=1 Tax=Micromonospora sp. DT43 TaxID=3393440 RepID=UPI003CF221E2
MQEQVAELQRLAALVAAQQQVIDRLAVAVDGPPADAAEPSTSTDGVAPDAAADGPSRAVDWFTVSGAERLAAWTALARFVELLVFRYSLQLEIRPCWWRHPEAVEELAALWHLRQKYFGPDGGLDDAMSWLDNLYKSRERLRMAFVACRETHVDTTGRAWMPDGIRADFAREIQRDQPITARLSPEPPRPAE